MAKVWKDHFTNTYNGFEKTLKNSSKEEIKEKSFAERMADTDALVAKLIREKARHKEEREDGPIRMGNVDYAEYRKNKDAIEADIASKPKKARK